MKRKLLGLFSASGQRALVLAALALVLYLGTLTLAKTLETYATYQQTARLRGDLERLQLAIGRLETLRDYELTDDFVEQIARRQLNLIKPGETAIIVVAPTPLAPTTEAPATEPPRPWWRLALSRLWPQTP